MVVVGWGGLFDYSVKPGPDLSKLRLSLIQLVTRSIKARFGQVGDQVSQVKDQVGQGQGQELDNSVCPCPFMRPREVRVRLGTKQDGTGRGA